MERLRIFLAEDNPADVALLREAFDRLGVACELQVVEDGHTAAALLAQVGRDLPCPDIFIVDLNLPKLDGTELRAPTFPPWC